MYGLEHFLCIKKANYIIRSGRTSELRDWLQVVARAMPITAADYNNLGYSLLNQKSDVPLAAELFERAVAIDPTMVVAWKNLQCCYESDADLERAIEVSKRALKHHPNDPGVFGNMAQALLRSGRLVEYIDFFVDKMISFFGNNLPADQRERIKQEAMSKVDTGDLRQIENVVRSMVSRTSQEK